MADSTDTSGVTEADNALVMRFCGWIDNEWMAESVAEAVAAARAEGMAEGQARTQELVTNLCEREGERTKEHWQTSGLYFGLANTIRDLSIEGVAVGRETEEPQRVRERVAVALYAEEVVSQEVAARIAGLSRSQFLERLAEAKVPAFQYSIEEDFEEAMRVQQKHAESVAQGRREAEGLLEEVIAEKERWRAAYCERVTQFKIAELEASVLEIDAELLRECRNFLTELPRLLDFEAHAKARELLDRLKEAGA